MANQEISTLLHKLIVSHYNKDELNTLTSIKLGVDYDNLKGETKSAKARELILYCERLKRTPDLLAHLREDRPMVTWPGAIGHARLPALYDNWEVMPGPGYLIGRDDLLEEVISLLEEKKRVLLTGLGGSGKTAVARTVAKQWVREGRGRVIWFEAGDEDSETILERLYSSFAIPDEKRELRRVSGEDKLRTGLHKLLKRLDPTLLALDDVWNGNAIEDIVSALPEGFPLLATSREHFAVCDEIPVSLLEPKDALQLIGHKAGGKDYRDDEEAWKLAESLGYLPFALEIAGAELKWDEFLSPGQLLKQIERAPHDVTKVGFNKDQYRASVRSLLDRSYNDLDEETKRVLLAFGSLFRPGATSALISIVLESDPKINHNLRELARRSLLTRTDENFYEIHRLTYSYAKEFSQNAGVKEAHTLTAVHRYVEEEAGANKLLVLDQDNILAATQLARTADVDLMVDLMYLLAWGGYFDANGHTPESLELMDETISVVEGYGEGRDKKLHYLYSKRGNYYIDQGDIENGLAFYRKALALSPNDFRKVVGLSAIGWVLAEDNSPAEADSYFLKARQVAESANNERALSFVLRQQSSAAFNLKEYEAAREHAGEAVRLTAPYEEEDPLNYAYSLLQLAMADKAAAEIRALSRDEDVLRIVEAEGDLPLMADAHYSLGLDYHSLHEDRDKAKRHLEQARELYKRLGATKYEIEVDRIIGQFGYDASE